MHNQLGALVESYAGGLVTDTEVLSLPDCNELGDDEQEVLLDILAADGTDLPRDSSVADLVEYAQQSYTGHTSLTDWADEHIDAHPQEVRHGESTENFAEMALAQHVWMLRRRDDSGQYWVMRQLDGN
jgi:hypothetical protein